ncbi:hypothetical protein WJX84_008789 [Apatococcus fuscideae]|uniref:cellulase n=1 Tax=Apatococcus fuscideae TaxID=2026836 RepID=A0AAW1THL8_9CHLO
MDLSGGYYEAGGSYLKFTLPTAFTVTQLAWGLVESRDGYAKVGELEEALGAVKWGADYLVNCHSGPTRLVAMFGDSKEDFAYFGPPEEHALWAPPREAHYITEEDPGTSSDASATLPCADDGHPSFLLQGCQMDFDLISYEENGFQTADLLAVSAAPFPSRPGALQLVTCDWSSLTVREYCPADILSSSSEQASAVPGATAPSPAADDATPSASLRMRCQPFNVLFRPSSVASTPDGRFIAAGGEGGLLSLARVMRQADGSIAVVGCCLLQLGSETSQQPRGPARPCSRRFVNSLRFGILAGKLRLLATSESGHIVIFNLPDPDAYEVAASAFMSTELGPACVGLQLGPHRVKGNQEIRPPGSPGGAGTNRIPFPSQSTPERCKSMSLGRAPLGRPTRAVDEPQYGPRHPVSLRLAHSDDSLWPGSSTPLAAAIPYCAWHPDSVRLAVSSDTLRTVFVCDAAKRVVLMRMQNLPQACLAVAVPPCPMLADSPVLVFAEATRNVYIADMTIRQLQWAIQKMKVAPPSKVVWGAPLYSLRDPCPRRIAGLAVTEKGQLIIALPDQILVKQLLQDWSPATHLQGFLGSFQAAVRTLLLISRHRHEPRAPTGLWSLPESVLQHVIGCAAYPLGSWMHHKPAVVNSAAI